MRFSHFVTIAATTFTLGLAHGAAYADEAGDKALSAVEAAMNRASSQYFEYEAVTTEAGKDEKKVGLSVYVQGEKRHTEFTAPSDLKGVKVLVLSPTEMYVYLPAFGKVRRIASHTSDQSAFGMAYSQVDLATPSYSGQYSAVSSGDTTILTPKSGQTPTYGKIELTIAKDQNLPSELKLYDTDGKLVKTETRSDYTCGDGDKKDVCTPGTLKMVDHTNGLTTTLTRKVWKLSPAIADDLFSKRNLEK